MVNQPVFLLLHHHCLAENVLADLPWKNTEQKLSKKKIWYHAVIMPCVPSIYVYILKKKEEEEEIA